MWWRICAPSFAKCVSSTPRLRMILTVSPVPLAATAEDRHVLAATTYSKSVLRVAAEQLARQGEVYYFPAYEIMMAAGNDYFAPDRRSIVEQGVQHVMSLFSRHLMVQATPSEVSRPEDEFLLQSRLVVDTLCDESRLDPGTEREHLPMTIDTMTGCGAAGRGDCACQDPAGASSVTMKPCRPDQRTSRERSDRSTRKDARRLPLSCLCGRECRPSDAVDPWADVPAGPCSDMYGISRNPGESARCYRPWRPVCGSTVRCWCEDCSPRKPGWSGLPGMCSMRWMPARHGVTWRSDMVKSPGIRACPCRTTASWRWRGPGWRTMGAVSGWPTRHACCHRLTELFRPVGIDPVVAEYFGEAPMMSVGKSTLRRVPKHDPGLRLASGWRLHGYRYPQRECVARAVRVRRGCVGPRGASAAIWSRYCPLAVTAPISTGRWALAWSSRQPRAAARSVRCSQPGDALLFDHFFLHRTGIPAAISKGSLRDRVMVFRARRPIPCSRCQCGL